VVYNAAANIADSRVLENDLFSVRANYISENDVVHVFMLYYIIIVQHKEVRGGGVSF